MSQPKKPVWWQLCLLYALLVALLVAQAPLAISQGRHQLIELVVTGSLVALMLRWSRRNHAALEEAALLRRIKQRAAQRQVALTPVQTHYLLSQERERCTQPEDTR